MAKSKKSTAPENNEVPEMTPLEEVVLEAVESTAAEAAPETEDFPEIILEAESVEDAAPDDPETPAPPVAPDVAATAAELPEEAPAPDPLPEEATQAQESGDSAASAPDSAAPEEPPEEDDGKTHISLSLPLEPFKANPGSIDRLKAAICSKQTLLKKALATETLDILVEEEQITFPWFTVQDESKTAEEVDAYSKLILALARKALTQKRVSSEEKLNSDERLGMRLYLINLGFIGDEYKSTRAILMRNFSGSSAARKIASDFKLAMPEVRVEKEKKHE